MTKTSIALAVLAIALTLAPAAVALAPATVTQADSPCGSVLPLVPFASCIVGVVYDTLICDVFGGPNCP